MQFRLLLILAFVAFLAPDAKAQDEVAPDTVTAEDYRIYSGSGEPLAWEDLVQRVGDAQVILVGENHNDPVAHHMEVAILQAALMMEDRPAAGSMEMFTTDVQSVVDEYLAGYITERHFRSESRPWQNYETDYRPFVEAARAAERPVIAANAPRRYVNRVSRLGPDSLTELPESAKQWLAPLPYAFASEAYKAEWDALMAEAMAGMPAPDSASGGNHGMGMGNALYSQSLWDATMAYSIARYLLDNPEDRVVHIVGSFHVKNGTGIPEHIEAYRPGTRQLIIVVEPVDDPTAFGEEHAGLGD
ncbi:MAG: ChaN family lipoprotein, partial [Rhodothermales bacterium]|nr:ChaN family lipoprotein [Rhodothermales bacterium]